MGIKGNILFIAISLIFLFQSELHATHAQGADITYTCLGGNLYEITATFYRDCGGISAPNSISTNIGSSCGTHWLSLNKISQQEVSPICNSMSTVCSGGNFPGVEEYIYKATTTLLPCTDWVISYSVCCRNFAITTLRSNYSLYIEARLDNQNYPCNSSPRFSNTPVPFICLNTPFCYNHGAYDIDGDSLSYTPITPFRSQGNTVTYIGGYSATQPLASTPPMTIDPVTGLICVTPIALEVSVMAMRVDEWRNGVKIGSVIRDVQIQVYNCGANGTPSVTGIDKTNIFQLRVCTGDSINFKVYSSDPDPFDSLTMIANLFGMPAGALFKIDSSNPAHPVGTFVWTNIGNIVSHIPYIFTVTVKDNNCPFNASFTQAFAIYVGGLGSLGPDIQLCDDTAEILFPNVIAALPPLKYLWLPDSQTTATILAGPGVYTLYVEDSLGCQGFDKIEVFAGHSPQASFSAPDVCVNGPVQFTDSSTSLSDSIISWYWDFGNNNGSSTWSNPSYQYGQPGTYLASLIVVDSKGCVDTTWQSIDVYAMPHAEIFVSQSTFCLGQQEQVSSTSSGPIQKLYWSFGDGLGDSVPNPSHQYAVAGVYVVGLEAINGKCRSVTETELTVLEDVHADFIATGHCLGEPVLFAHQCTGAVNNWEWSFGDGNGTSNKRPKHTYLMPGLYNVMLTASNGYCSDTISKPIRVYKPPTAEFTATEVCFGEQTQFSDLSQEGEGPILGWEWSIRQQVFEDRQHPGYLFEAAGQYSVQLLVQDSFCSNSSSLLVTINEVPWVDLGPDKWVCLSEPIELEVISNADELFWYNGESGSAITSETYLISGAFPVWVQGSISECSAVDLMLLHNECEGKLYVPNAFTPNGDLSNDIYKIYGEHVRTISYIIHDRWGEKVFESNSLDIGWDGSFKGRRMNSGIFIVSGGVHFYDNRFKRFSEEIRLIR